MYATWQPRTRESQIKILAPVQKVYIKKPSLSCSCWQRWVSCCVVCFPIANFVLLSGLNGRLSLSKLLLSNALLSLVFVVPFLSSHSLSGDELCPLFSEMTLHFQITTPFFSHSLARYADRMKSVKSKYNHWGGNAGYGIQGIWLHTHTHLD